MRFAALALAVALAVVACGQPRAPMNHAHGRAAFVHMGIGVTAAARQCTRHAQWLASSGFGEAGDELAARCVAKLGPARDALAFNVEHVDPWTLETEPRIGCTGRAVRFALEALAVDFVTFRVRVPAAMHDAAMLGAWAEPFAPTTCDARSPTTLVTLTIDPAIPDVEPDYPTTAHIPGGGWIGGR